MCFVNLFMGQDMGRTCSTIGGEEGCIEDIGRKARRKETTGKTKT
jgi:hypothetical protein